LTTRQIRGGALSAVGLVCALAVSASVVRAQSALPTGWASRDVGSTGMVGSASASSGTWTVAGSGANIWGTSDEFRFAYRQITGDVDISVRLESIEDAQTWSKAGLMIRETLSANSRNAYLTLIPGSGVFMQSRASQGGSTARLTGRAGAAPVWLRLVRRGNQFTSYLSSNGTSWTTAGTVTNNMAAAAYVGLAVTSRADSVITTATFTNLRVGLGSGTTTLPAPWANRDVGSPALAGSASAASGTFTVTAGGENIWGTSDEFHFVYQRLQGDVEVIARVASLQYADPWSKTGVMIRESLTGGSRYAFMMGTGTEGWGFQRRIATGDVSYREAGPSSDAPGWVRLVREGNLFTAYHSTNGTTWSLVGSDAISMASTVYVGVALTSYDTARRATATFTNLTARPPTTGTNQPPTVSITSPAAGASFAAPATITVTAAASDTDGTITKVDFYRGSQLIGSDTTNTYSATASGLTAGTYQLTAVATDSDGVTRTSSPVSVTVNGTTNRPPTVSLTSPAANSTFTAPASITVTASAADTDGYITRVDFYQGSTRIGSDTSSPYSYTWTNVGAGSYQLTARAVDDDGATQTSTGANITVSTVVAPRPTRLAFTASANHATSVSSYIVAIYRGADPVTASPVTTRDLGKPAPVGGDITADISTLVNPLPAGTYKAVVRASGPGGTTASAPSATFSK
jgi:regulation of enolase protein 1 (concanavalin A-like superfamily)